MTPDDHPLDRAAAGVAGRVVRPVAYEHRAFTYLSGTAAAGRAERCCTSCPLIDDADRTSRLTAFLERTVPPSG